MRPYEVMVIFDAGVEPPSIQAVVDRILETIRTNDGAPGHVDRWGRRPFAYEVRHRREGYYVLVEFSGGSQTVAELDRILALADEVLRHKVIRLPEKATRRAPSTGPGRGGARASRPPSRVQRDEAGDRADRRPAGQTAAGDGSAAPEPSTSEPGDPEVASVEVDPDASDGDAGARAAG